MSKKLTKNVKLKVLKHKFPAYSNREYLDGLQHKTLSERRLRPELVAAVSDTVSKLVEAECTLIRTRADARIAKAQEELYKTSKGGKK